MLNFNDAQIGGGGLIPAGTKAKVRAEIEYGGQGDKGILTRSQTSTALYILFKLTILEGAYAGRIVRLRVGIQGREPRSEGDYYAEQGRSQIRAILDAAYGLHPEDASQAAAAARCIESYEDLIGLKFAIEIGIEPVQSKQLNQVKRIITPDDPSYREVMGDDPDQVPF